MTGKRVLPVSRVAKQDRRLWFALGISLGIHALLLTLHFQFPERSQAFREKAMDIILVNAKSSRKPTDAQALAQSNLDGGGNTDENRRAKTPLPPSPQKNDGDAIQQMQRRVQELEAAQQRLLTQAKNLRSVAAATTASEQPSPVVPSVSGLDLAESARAMARLEGEISKTADEYSKKPRKKFVGARTEEYGLAAYLDGVRRGTRFSIRPPCAFSGCRRHSVQFRWRRWAEQRYCPSPEPGISRRAMPSIRPANERPLRSFRQSDCPFQIPGHSCGFCLGKWAGFDLRSAACSGRRL